MTEEQLAKIEQSLRDKYIVPKGAYDMCLELIAEIRRLKAKEKADESSRN